MSNDQPAAKTVPDEPPPFLRTWSRVYAAIIGWLAVLIFLFFLFSKAFSA
ncbi:MAG TPA: hypothetical protein VLE22_02450 [Bryobacteraceae bacterium]|nr:hypothetical protein [Bryobacteraceae bacterium]